jgi:3-deoxy-D-manno-octulosonate 8-phosphate phosphatase KdsC-like HAD superfamily phosphatase
MAVGDQLNDLEMVAAVGHGAAMANAPDELRSHARYVAPSVHDEGAAAIIEALVLGPAGRASRSAREFLMDGDESPVSAHGAAQLVESA